jgi:hypothetical protein
MDVWGDPSGSSLTSLNGIIQRCSSEDTQQYSNKSIRSCRRACDQCRISKAACSFHDPTCTTCERKGIDCTWKLAEKGSTPPPASAPAAGDELARIEPIAPDRPILHDGNVKKLVSIYFFRVYNVSW